MFILMFSLEVSLRFWGCLCASPLADKKEEAALVGAHGLTVTHKGTHTDEVAVLVFLGPGAEWG